MKPFRLHLLLLASLLTVVAACNSRTHSQLASASTPTTAPSAYLEADRLHDALFYIASDELEGRGLATEGINKAADYIARNFKDSGLKPVPGLDGYFQPFETVISTKVGDETSLSFAGRALNLKEEFSPVGISGEGEFDAPLAWVGYGIASEQYKYDDYEGIDVGGKAVLAMRYEPHDSDGNSRFEPNGWSDQAALSAKAKAAADHGAVALILVNPPQYHGPDRLMSFARGSGVERASIPVLMIKGAAADEVLKSAGKNLKSLQSAIDSTGQPNSFALARVNSAGHVQIDREKKLIKNVVAYLPGKGADKDEYIVLGAHYDHLGRGERGSLGFRSNEIHNGADDNGSGTVSIIEIARKLARKPRQRSIIFVAFTGEERGLLGSAHFVKHPPVPLDKIVAMVNLDMVGRVRDNVIFAGGTGTAEPLQAIVADADARSPLIVKTAGADVGGKGGIGPSDHETFALKKIPVVFLYSGMHMDYHRPTDDPEKINYLGMAMVVDLTTDIVDGLARMSPAQYVDKFDRSMGRMGRNNVQFGIMPDYNSDGSTPGVRVAGTVPDTAAAHAGIKEGDVIIGFDDSKVSGLGDYMTVLGKHKPGDKVKVRIIRDNQEMQLEATLLERRG